jgi:hypothetical protein
VTSPQINSQWTAGSEGFHFILYADLSCTLIQHGKDNAITSIQWYDSLMNFFQDRTLDAEKVLDVAEKLQRGGVLPV